MQAEQKRSTLKKRIKHALAMDVLAKAYPNGNYGLEKSPVKWEYWQKRAKETIARTHEVDPSSWTIFNWIKYKLGN